MASSTPLADPAVIRLIRFLAAGRKQYFHGDLDHFHEMTPMDKAIFEEYTTAEHIADILEGKNDAQGWLPSWLWDEFEKMTGAINRG